MNEIRIPAKFLEQYVSGDWYGSQMMIPVQLHGIDIVIVLPRVDLCPLGTRRAEIGADMGDGGS